MKVTESPQSSVKEGETSTFRCSSDEGNPPPVILWNRGSWTDEVKSRKFHASITESTQYIMVDRTMNKEEIGCYIEEDETKGQKRLENKVELSVICE